MIDEYPAIPERLCVKDGESALVYRIIILSLRIIIIIIWLPGKQSTEWCKCQWQQGMMMYYNNHNSIKFYANFMCGQNNNRDKGEFDVRWLSLISDLDEWTWQ